MPEPEVCVFCDGTGDSETGKVDLPCSHEQAGAFCKACQDVVEIEKMIAEATEKLVAMRQKRYKLLSEVNRTHDSIIHRFPPEISARILQEPLPKAAEYDWDTMTDDWEKVNASQVLAQVSRQWRRFVLSTQSLWTVVSFFIKASDDPKPFAYLLPLLLRRSGNMPLSIIVLIAHPVNLRSHWRRHRTTMKAMIGMINRQSHRLAFLKIMAPNDWLALLNLKKYKAPMLRHLEIWTPDGHAEYYDSNSDSPYSETPSESFDRSSQQLAIGRDVEPSTLVLRQWSISQINISTARLVRVEVLQVSFQACLQILETCPALEFYSVNEIIQFVGDASGRVLRHSNLRDLVLRYGCNEFLAAVDLPNLQRFSAGHLFTWVFLDEILSLFHRSTPSLEGLDLEFSGWGFDTTLQQILANIMRSVGQTIQVVSLKATEYPNFIVPDLKDLIGTPLPSLRSLTLFEVESTWSRTLFQLVHQISALDPGSCRPRVEIRVWVTKSDAVNNVEHLLSSSIFNQPTTWGGQSGVVDLAAIMQMLAIIDSQSLSISVQTHKHYPHYPEADKIRDIFPDIKHQLAKLCTSPAC